MAKYLYEFKLEVVQYYLSGSGRHKRMAHHLVTFLLLHPGREGSHLIIRLKADDFPYSLCIGAFIAQPSRRFA